MNGGDPFSLSRMPPVRGFPNRRFAAAREPIEEENPAAPPWRRGANLTADNQSLINSCRSAALTPQEWRTCLPTLFRLMTSSGEEGMAQFLEVVSALEENGLPSMASLLTSNSIWFLETARNKNGSFRLHMLLGISDDADAFFFAAILGRFFDFMTDEDASNVAIQGMQVFNEAKRKAMHPLIVFHMFRLACDRRGYVALKKIITNLGHGFLRDELVDKVASDALSLSYNAFGNNVVQHVVELHDLSTTLKVADNLDGHFINLSLTKSGSYVVEFLLRTKECWQSFWGAMNAGW